MIFFWASLFYIFQTCIITYNPLLRMGNQIADNSDNSLMQDIEDGYE